MVIPYLFVVSVHVLLCILLVLVILLQPGKGGDVGAAFGGGGGGGGQVFGPRGPAGLLARATTGVAVMFMITSITLSYYSNKSLLNDADLGDEIERLEQERQEKEASEAGSDEAVEGAPGEESADE